MKKRILAFLLVMVTVLSLVACTDSEGYVTTTTTGSDSNGLYTDYLPTDSIEDEATTDVPVVSSTTTTTTTTATTTVSEEPPVTDIPVVSTETSTSTSTKTTSTFKKTWSYSTDKDTSSNNGSAIVTEKWEPLDLVENQVIALDQQTNGGRVVVYDIAKAVNGNLEKGEIWSYDCGYAAGVKYRTDTKFGNVVLIAGKKHQIVTYPGKQVKWSVKQHSGANPHSIEILPSGNVVIASSTDGKVLLYDTTKSNSYKVYDLVGAHGVLWDPTNKLLWALGDNQIVSYSVSGSGSSEALVKQQAYNLPKTGGHDLAPDYFSKDHLYLTVVGTVYRFHKESGTFYSSFYGASAIVTNPREDGTETRGENVKGFGINENSCFFYCFPNYGKGTAWQNDSKADWCTDQIHFIRQTGARTYKTEVYTSSKAAFYKCRVFCGKYQ